ncbi:protein PAM71, chloroplastic isoform X5 [Cryptomeria japonica]|uniref:protein PAM71, chloroplastic isoform X5 n=1 Tax=Cryptomeria japonica TaxID=3369 RepID=UPI0025AD947D|nr:protein PAM71, chloroplastic isoform X5 [Cryptomeria japonica]
MITIQWAYGPSMGISAFKTTKAKGESNYTQRMRSLQALPASAAAPKRHSNKSPWCIRRDLGSDLKQLADLPVSMIDHAFLLIFFSELGDKTFFIAALLASRKSTAAVFLGTFGALAVMTVISVFLGRTFHYVDGIVPIRLGQMELPLDDLAAVGLLVYFGVSTLLEASSGDESKTSNEKDEAELAIAGVSGGGAGILAAANTVISTFALVFVAEWGDKSFFSTIALAAASSPLGVVGGAVAGHGVATLIAVLGGSLLATYLSEKVITYTGGVLFLVFAAITLIEIFV